MKCDDGTHLAPEECEKSSGKRNLHFLELISSFARVLDLCLSSFLHETVNDVPGRFICVLKALNLASIGQYIFPEVSLQILFLLIPHLPCARHSKSSWQK